MIWRGYFKGWLERRPQVWTHYRDGIADDLAIIAIDRGLRRKIEEAQSGATGLDCFDAWVDSTTDAVALLGNPTVKKLMKQMVELEGVWPP